MPKTRSLGWIIAVRGPQDASPQLYATVADGFDRAMALVGDHLGVTNERVEFHKILTDAEMRRLGLKLGEVKPYA
jgi:hypothetical protein